MDQEKIGAFIRDIRKENQLTQEQLAERLGVSQRSVSRWETGKTLPDYSLLPGICEALNVSVVELLEAERIEGDCVSKKQAAGMARDLISLTKTKSRVRKIIGAVLSAAVMLACVVGLYCHEFHVSLASKAELESAINDYHFNDEVSVDVLEWQALGNRLYVLYGEKDHPGACGLARLEKGIFGNYRFIGCRDSEYRWIHADETTVRGTKYCVTYCVNELAGIDSYALPGDGGRIDYGGSPFLKFTRVADSAVISSFQIKYYRNGEEIQPADLPAVLGERTVEGAPFSGYGTAEMGMFYFLEGIVLLLGFVFIRYFLTEAGEKSENQQRRQHERL